MRLDVGRFDEMLDLLRSADHEIACVIIGSTFGPAREHRSACSECDL